MIIDALKKYDEIVALYDNTLNKLANASDTECEEAFSKLPLPESWQKILSPFADMEIPFYFGLMPSEFWFALVKSRPEIRDAARCFESGRVALVCAGMEGIETLDELLREDNPNAGFHWCDILINRPVFIKLANEKGAWNIIRKTPFCIETLIQEKPQFVRKFTFEEIINLINDEDKKSYFTSNPELMASCEKNFPDKWNDFTNKYFN